MITYHYLERDSSFFAVVRASGAYTEFRLDGATWTPMPSAPVQGWSMRGEYFDLNEVDASALPAGTPPPPNAPRGP